MWTLARTARADADVEEEASSLLRITVKDSDSSVVGRAFSSLAVELGLSSYPGFTLTAPPDEGKPFGVYKPAYVPATEVPHVAVLHDGTRVPIPPRSRRRPWRRSPRLRRRS